ncbi:hypothetical protein D7Y15_23205 [Corallococcus sp. AB030]|nr:hypothetical protein D7Y15_23205 [Corallococcus sp. AB030]
MVAAVLTQGCFTPEMEDSYKEDPVGAASRDDLSGDSARSGVGGCCKYCGSDSKPCGDSCISLDKTCHKGPGCAC